MARSGLQSDLDLHIMPLNILTIFGKNPIKTAQVTSPDKICGHHLPATMPIKRGITRLVVAGYQ